MPPPAPNLLTPGERQLFSDGQYRQMPEGKWAIYGLKVCPVGTDTDAVIEVTLRRQHTGSVIYYVVLHARGPEWRSELNPTVWSWAGEVELLVTGGAVEVIVEATSDATCQPARTARAAAEDPPGPV